MSCRWVASDQPRVITGRHDDACPDPETCRGCQSCTEPHCRVCNVRHDEGACPECRDEVRDALAEIGRMCGDLPAEAEVKGVESEVFNLLGPVCDPEARGHVEASYRAGRLPEGWLETGTHGKDCPLLVNEACTGCGGNELHPLTVMWWWNECYREAFEHDETPAVGPAFGILDLIGYLDRNLTYAGSFPDVPFEDFAREVKSCRNHLEAVLHDQRQGERAGVGCFECGSDLERRLARDGFEDFWTCRKCQRRYTSPEYNFALRAKLEESLSEGEPA